METNRPRFTAPTPESLSNACKHVDFQLGNDMQYPDLTAQLGVQSDSAVTLSGLRDFDYPSFSTQPSLQSLKSLQHVGDIKKTPLPHELLEQFKHMQCSCYMGLFPKIGRAWLTIDSDVFIWNYEDGSDLAYFDGMNEAILCVGLVAPKPGIFQSHIKYLLCLATAVEIVLLGVSFSGSGMNVIGEMHLQPDPLYTFQSDGVHIKLIESTESGRIFLAGGDGCLYEIYYQAHESWFSSRCKLINHSTSKLSFLLPSFLSFGDEDSLVEITIDGSRNILYTRSTSGIIQVFDLGFHGQDLKKVTLIRQEDIARKAAVAARTMDETLFKPIIHISAVTTSDSPFLHLVAVSQAGVRLYFTTCALQPGAAVNPTARPVHIALVHCRMPPGYSPSTATNKPTNIHAAFYKQGTLLLASAQTEDVDSLWWIHSDTFPVVPNQNILHESQMSLNLGGRTMAIAEIPTHPRHVSLMAPVGRAAVPVITSQHVMPHRQVVLLSTQGTCLCTQMRPVEQLRQILNAARGADSDVVQGFFQLHKPDQACAMCLVLATSTAPADQQIAQWATLAFFRYGGEPRLLFTPPTTVGPAGIQQQQQQQLQQQQQQFSNVLQQTDQTLSVNQLQSPSHGALGRAVSRPDVAFSGKHNGLCLYFGRLVAPLWENTIVSNQSASNLTADLTSRFTLEDLQTFSDKATGLRAFLERNQQFVTFHVEQGAAASPGNLQRRLLQFMSPQQQTGGDGTLEPIGVAMQRKHQAETFALERNSLANIVLLVQRTIESLSLWHVICEHSFTTVASKLQQAEKDLLRRIMFKDFVVGGQQLCDALIQCLMGQYISDRLATDNISRRMRELCPTLFSQDDAARTKATEMLALAKATENIHEKKRLLEESLQLFSQVSHRIDLSTVCKQYADVGFYVGVLDLSLCAAEKRDPQGLALHHYKWRQPADDIPGAIALTERNRCYSCVMSYFQSLLVTSRQVPSISVLPRSQGSQAVQQAPAPSTQAAETLESALQHALKSGDELFHVAIYDWHLNAQIEDKLLEVQSPFIEAYLKQTALSQSISSLTIMDLLWKYYERNQDFLAAARILSKLSERASRMSESAELPELQLRQRVEYLSRAVMCAKSVSVRTKTPDQGDFLHELEEKLEVAGLQLQLQQVLEQKAASADSEEVTHAISLLDSQLMDITKLYEEFADKFDLSECKLAIVHCAGHYDPTLIESLWTDIILEELNHSQHSDPPSRMEAMRSKLLEFGQKYSQSERFFPIPVLIKQLEQHSCQLSWEPSWLFSTFLTLGVSLVQLHTVYDTLFKSKDPCWQSYGKPHHILKVLHLLLSSFASNPAVLHTFQRQSFLTRSLDSIATYLVELESVPSNSSDHQVQQTLRDFKALQRRLQRGL